MYALLFIIDPCDEVSIYRTWRTRAGKRLRDIFYDIRENGASINWLTDEILQELRAYWDSPGFKAKQARPKQAEDQPELALCTLEAPLPSRACG